MRLLLRLLILTLTPPQRLAQMHHTQTLSAQTILALRKDLSDKPTTDTPDDTARTAFLEQINRQLEVKVSTLERDLVAAQREASRWRDIRTGETLTLADSAKSRLAVLSAQLSDTTPDETAAQQTLAQLVADNTLLRHDNAQLSLVLAELRHGTRHTRTTSRASNQRHSISDRQSFDAPSRTNPRHSIFDTPSRPDVYPRPLTLSISSTGTSAPSHSRHQSLTPSLGGHPPPPYTYHTRTDSYTPVLASPRSAQAEEGKRPVGRRTCSIDRPSLVNRGGTVSPLSPKISTADLFPGRFLDRRELSRGRRSVAHARTRHLSLLDFVQPHQSARQTTLPDALLPSARLSALQRRILSPSADGNHGLLSDRYDTAQTAQASLQLHRRANRPGRHPLDANRPQSDPRRPRIRGNKHHRLIHPFHSALPLPLALLAIPAHPESGTIHLSAARRPHDEPPRPRRTHEQDPRACPTGRRADPHSTTQKAAPRRRRRAPVEFDVKVPHGASRRHADVFPARTR